MTFSFFPFSFKKKKERNLWLFKMSALIVFGRAIELLHASANIQMDAIRLCLLLCMLCVLLLRHTLAIQMRQISLIYFFIMFSGVWESLRTLRLPFPNGVSRFTLELHSKKPLSKKEQHDSVSYYNIQKRAYIYSVCWTQLNVFIENGRRLNCAMLLIVIFCL